MKLLRFVVGLVLAILIQTLGHLFFPQFSAFFDLFLVLVVYHSLDSTPAWSAIGGSAAGLAQDALSGGLYGLHGFANTLVAYTASRLQQRLVIQQPSQVGLVFVVAAALQVAILAALQFLLVSPADTPDLASMVARMATSGLIGALLFVLTERFHLWERRRQARQRRVKI